MPEISVIIPTYNRAAMLADTIASARSAGGDCEILIVDDASTDGTEQLCRQLEGIRYLRLDRNVGSSAARNAGIAAASGNFVAFLDDDDLRLPDTFDRQLALLKAAPSAAMVYARAFLGEARFGLPTGTMVPDELPSDDVYWQLLEANFVTLSTVLARKACLLEAGLFNPDLDMLEDYDLWVRIAERYPVIAFEAPVAIYRVRSETSGQKTSNRAAHERRHKKLHAGLLRAPRASAAPRSQRRRVHRRHMRIIYGSLIHDAALAVVNGDAAAAREYLWAAARLNPLHIKAHVSLLWLFGRSLLQKLN